MSSHPTKTDNSFFEEKVKLRIDNLPPNDPLFVLDMYAGTGRIWDEVKLRSKREIIILGIEKRKIEGRVYLRGLNEKYQLDYDVFHVIDVDAYGIPFFQMKQIFDRSKVPITVFITFIRSVFGVLPHGLLDNLGYSKAMYTKARTLFNLNGDEKFLRFLANMGVRHVKLFRTSDGDKNYACIKINENSTLQIKDETSRPIVREKSK